MNIRELVQRNYTSEIEELLEAIAKVKATTPTILVSEQAQDQAQEQAQTTAELVTVTKPLLMEQVVTSRGFSVKSSCTPDSPKLIRDMAMLLGNNTSQLSFLMKQLRNAISSSKNNTAYIVPKGSAEEITFLNTVIEKLHSLGYIESVRKNYTNNAINFVVTANQKCTAFLNGGWMELWLYETAVQLCKELELDCEAKTNVCLVKNGESKLFSEHDLLLYVGGQLVWVEAKSGEFINSLQKYHELGRTLGVVPQYTVLVAANLTDPDEAEALSYNFDYHVCPALAFEQTLRKLLVSIKEQAKTENMALAAQAAA